MLVGLKNSFYFMLRVLGNCLVRSIHSPDGVNAQCNLILKRTYDFFNYELLTNCENLVQIRNMSGKSFH